MRFTVNVADPAQHGREVSRVASVLLDHATADHELSPEDCRTLGNALHVIAQALARPARRTAMSDANRPSDADLNHAVDLIVSVRAELARIGANRLADKLTAAAQSICRHRCLTPAPAPAEPVIITGGQARNYPNGSQVVRVDPDDHAKIDDGAMILTIGKGGVPIRGERYRVLYRAPEPEKPRHVFRVGQRLHLKSDVDALPVGTAVRLPKGDVARKAHDGVWVCTAKVGALPDPELFGARIIDLPDES